MIKQGEDHSVIHRRAAICRLVMPTATR